MLSNYLFVQGLFCNLFYCCIYSLYLLHNYECSAFNFITYLFCLLLLLLFICSLIIYLYRVHFCNLFICCYIYSLLHNYESSAFNFVIYLFCLLLLLLLLFICSLIIYLYRVHYCNLFVYCYIYFLIFITKLCLFRVYFCYLFVLFANIYFYLFAL